MTANELLNPRFELIANYPYCPIAVGNIISFSDTHNFDPNNTSIKGHYPEYLNIITKEQFINYYNKYPHLFRQLNWWEYRTKEQMPKKLKHIDIEANSLPVEIEEWDMKSMFGYVNKEQEAGCSLLSWKPEHGYIPVD